MKDGDPPEQQGFRLVARGVGQLRRLAASGWAVSALAASLSWDLPSSRAGALVPMTCVMASQGFVFFAIRSTTLARLAASLILAMVGVSVCGVPVSVKTPSRPLSKADPIRLSRRTDRTLCQVAQATRWSNLVSTPTGVVTGSETRASVAGSACSTGPDSGALPDWQACCSVNSDLLGIGIGAWASLAGAACSAGGGLGGLARLASLLLRRLRTAWRRDRGLDLGRRSGLLGGDGLGGLASLANGLLLRRLRRCRWGRDRLGRLREALVHVVVVPPLDRQGQLNLHRSTEW